MIHMERAPSWADALALPRAASTASLNGRSLRYTGSGKASIALILEYLRKTGELPDKMAEVVVPAWIGNPVYHQVNWFGFPTLGAGPKARALMMYHQYGFPQDVDRTLAFARERGLVVIEDCAHAAAGEHKGRALGTFGRFALYSFSKFAFCYALGGVAFDDAAFGAFADESLRSASGTARLYVNAVKLADEANFSLRRPLLPGPLELIRKAAYAVYGDARRPSRRAVGLWEAKREAELAARRRNYAAFRAETEALGVCSHLEREGVVPYAIPVRLPEERQAALVETLSELGVRAGIYRFDFNRFHLEPDFRKCVLIPCHGGLGEADMARIAAAVRAAGGKA